MIGSMSAPQRIERVPPSRGRRSARAAGDERERAILTTAERLLRQRSLAEISVDDLAQGAGISRSAFYFYFPSKDAVVLTLVDRVVEQAGAARDRVLELQAEDAQIAWRDGIQSFYEVFGAHRPVIRAVTDLSATNSEARELWSQVMDGWVAHVAGMIEAERERGAAPAGVAARDLATALVQMNERVLQAIFIEETPAVREQEVIDTLTHVWRSAIYGTHRAPSGSSATS
jgi:TetR/AcrR family transcriptional regulator, ethionamide resistance regulator